MNDPITLLIDGRRYGGWTAVRVTRGLTRSATDFEVEVSERWAGQAEPWRIKPFSTCQVFAGKDKLMTGYIDEYTPSGGASAHSVRISGRSKTSDLIDCMPDIKSGQFSGYALSAIARAVAEPFGIAVAVETPNAERTIINANIEPGETAWGFLERLCRLVGVLATDDPEGRLVLTNVGNAKAAGRLVYGENINRYSARLSAEKRWSVYILKGQTGIDGAGPAGGTNAWEGVNNGPQDVPDGPGPAPPAVAPAGGPVATVRTNLRVQTEDPEVPRYRPHVAIAESQMSLEQMQHRVEWQKRFAFGQSAEARITVPGWRQPNGSLWQVNQIVSVTCAMIGADVDLLISGVTWSLSDQGHETEFTLNPVEAFEPDPNKTRVERGGKIKNKSKSGTNWTGVAVPSPDPL